MREKRGRKFPRKARADWKGGEQAALRPGAPQPQPHDPAFSASSTSGHRAIDREQRTPRSPDQDAGSAAHLDALVVAVPRAAEAGEAAQVAGGARAWWLLWRSRRIWLPHGLVDVLVSGLWGQKRSVEAPGTHGAASAPPPSRPLAPVPNTGREGRPAEGGSCHASAGGWLGK